MAKDPSNRPPWYWHLYRPEALLVYIVIGFYIYWRVGGQPGSSNALRMLPTKDGGAICLGFEANAPEQPLLWLIEADGEIQWTVNLPDNYLRPASQDQFRPVLATDGQYAFVLTGLQRNDFRQLLSLHQIELRTGELTWTNTTQPSGDADFEAVFYIGNALVTVHRVAKDTRKLYVTRRSLRDGSMLWNRLFEWEPRDFRRETANKTAFKPLPTQMGIYKGDSLYLLEMERGTTTQKFRIQNSFYHGGWLWYRDSIEVRGYEFATQEDILLFRYQNPIFTGSEGPEPQFLGGFYNGFPSWNASGLSWGRMEGDSAILRLPGPCPSTPEAWNTSVYPPNHSHFLAEEWTRFLPFWIDYQDWGIGFFDLEKMEKVYRSATLDSAFFSTPWMFSYSHFHYLLFLDGEKRYVILQFDGDNIDLTKAVRFQIPEADQLPVRLDQPVGGRFWLGGNETLVALDASTLDIVYSSNGEVPVESVLEEYADMLEYAYEPQ